MLAVALVCASLSHTPGHFLDDCNTNPIVLSDVNVSQVHYMRLKPTCNYTFAPDTCRFQRVSMHRFRPKVTTGFLSISGDSGVQRHDECLQEKEGEPFTLTPYVTTVELDDVDAGDQGCTITVGGDDYEVAMLVIGKAEEWWLALTIPYEGYHIRHAWENGNMNVWYWPFGVYLVFVAYLSFRFYVGHPWSGVVVWDLFWFSVLVDFAWPTMHTASALEEWPQSRIWTALVLLRVLTYSTVAAVILRCETDEHFQSSHAPRWPALVTARWAVGAFLLYLVTVATGIGGYVLVPLLVVRYGLPTPRKRASAHGTPRRRKRPAPTHYMTRVSVAVVYAIYAVAIGLALDGRLPLRTVLIVCLSIHFSGLLSAAMTAYVCTSWHTDPYPEELGALTGPIVFIDVVQFVLLAVIAVNDDDAVLHATAAVALVGIAGCFYKLTVISRAYDSRRSRAGACEYRRQAYTGF